MVDKSEEDEADDEGETESDEGSLETLSSGLCIPFLMVRHRSKQCYYQNDYWI